MQVEPFFSLGQHIKDADRVHLVGDHLLDRIELRRWLGALHEPDDDAALVDIDVAVLRETLVHVAGQAAQFFAQLRHERLRLHRQADQFAVGAHVPLILVPVDQVVAIVVVIGAVFDVQVAGLQFVHHLGHDGQLEIFPVRAHGRTGRATTEDKLAPFVGHPVERQFGQFTVGRRQLLLVAGAMLLNNGDRRQQAVVL